MTVRAGTLELPRKLVETGRYRDVPAKLADAYQSMACFRLDAGNAPRALEALRSAKLIMCLHPDAFTLDARCELLIDEADALANLHTQELAGELHVLATPVLARTAAEATAVTPAFVAAAVDAVADAITLSGHGFAEGQAVTYRAPRRAGAETIQAHRHRRHARLEPLP